MRTQVRLGSNCRTRRVWRSKNWRSCVTEIVKIQTVGTEWNIPITSQNVKRNRGYYMAETKFLFSCWKIFHSFAALTREIFSTREEKFLISKRPFKVLFIIKTPMKYQTISMKQFFPAKGAIHYVAIATVIFSRVKITCFRAKAHLVFHWCLYNK